MSRYVLLFLLNLPFILMAILSAITRYKLKKSSKRRLFAQLALWLTVLAGLALTYPIYSFLSDHELTNTEPLSLFDVVQITAIVIVLYIANRTRARLDTVERRLQDLHQELSIRLSKK